MDDSSYVMDGMWGTEEDKVCCMCGDHIAHGDNGEYCNNSPICAACFLDSFDN